MKVFISWSGERSKAAAELLTEWIHDVIQAVKPWISTRDIDKGSIWFNEITETFKDTSLGIICLTPENKDKPWILFESGALLSVLNKQAKPHVCTFLIGLKPADIENPLAQFNHTGSHKTEIFELLITINKQLESNRLEEKSLKKAFNTYWPEFNERFKEILAIKPEKEVKVNPRTEDSMMKEMLLTMRSLEQRLRENKLPHNPNNADFSPGTSPEFLYKKKEIIKDAISSLEKGDSVNTVIDFLTSNGFLYSDAHELVNDPELKETIRRIEFFLDNH